MIDPDGLQRLAAEMNKPREVYLRWKQVCDRYDRGKHSKLATLFMEATPSTVEARKQEAYASEEYANYLNEWDLAEKNKIKAQVELDNLTTAFDALQSALAYARAEMKHAING